MNLNLDYCLEAAEEFATIIWPKRNKLRVIDLMLRGSVARKEPDPFDLDMIIIHKNLGLDEFQKLLRSKNLRSDEETLTKLNHYLKEINMAKLLKKTRVRHLISKNLFQTSYINVEYFSNPAYKKEWDKDNDKGFAKTSFHEGLLWNPKTEKYDIKASTKYRV
jgi:hypothetical protein